MTSIDINKPWSSISVMSQLNFEALCRNCCTPGTVLFFARSYFSGASLDVIEVWYDSPAIHNANEVIKIFTGSATRYSMCKSYSKIFNVEDCMC